MKRILLITGLMFLAWSFGTAQSNNLNVVVGVDTSYYTASMTATVDTADIAFTSPHKRLFNCYTVTAYSSAVDTMQIWILCKDGTTWSQCGAVDLADNTDETSLLLSTTKHKFIILDPEPMKIRLISTSDDASTSTAIVAGERSE